MRLACYGFADEQRGSLVGANYLVLCELLRRGVEVDFFNKDSFMPLKSLRDVAGFRFVDCNNPPFAGINQFLRGKINSVPRQPFQVLDHQTFAHQVVRKMRAAHQLRRYDCVLYLGTAVFGRLENLPTVAWLQGPPGTDARSVVDNWNLLVETGGSAKSWLFRLYGHYRETLGAPNYRYCDRIILGSQWSANAFQKQIRAKARVEVLPYPAAISLQAPRPCPKNDLEFSLLWLGRIVPRKRLDVFLEGSKLAIQAGVPLKLTVVGQLGFFAALRRLLESFPFPERLEWITHVPKSEVPELLNSHDVLAQPSDEENFGSSVAEAQLAGLPVIVGATNGTADYICTRSVHLAQTTASAFADALILLWKRRSTGNWGERADTIAHAESQFSVVSIVNRLTSIIEATMAEEGNLQAL